MPLSNGDNCDISDLSKFEDRVREPSSESDTKEDIPIEANFRGFSKVPNVLLQRIDITPYLKRTPINNTTSNYDKYKHDYGSAFLSLCSVKIIKNDLLKLKEAFYNNKQTPNVTLVDSEMSTINLKCKICDKVYNSEKKLQNHNENKHMIIYKSNKQKVQKRVSFSDKVIIHELKKFHKCRKCTNIFEDYKCLKAHMKQEHKKRKCYICNYCLKKFVDRMFFKVHIKLHCDVCGLLFPNKTKYVEHRRNVCRILRLHKCKACDDTFFRIMDVKDHSYDHMDINYVCDICKDQCKTKCSMAHHIGFLHSKVRPTSLYEMRNLGSERLYLCNFCDESSVDRDLIQSHVDLLPDLNNKAMTGYKDYYFCDHCLEKFDMEKDMLQHKWTHFLKTSDNSQLRSKNILSNINSNIKTIYKLDEKLPDHIKQPKIVLEKIKVDNKLLEDNISFIDVNNFDVRNGEIKKPVVDPKSKKTIFSKHQCETCNKYYSSRYCLNRHIETQHSDYENLRCNVCEETFVWPSLLQTHNCIRLNIPEMPFDDARPEIHLSNLHQFDNGVDDFNIVDDDDYMNTVDFEIPAPIVEFTEYDNVLVPSVINGNNSSEVIVAPRQGGYYKIVMQEVPIEF